LQAELLLERGEEVRKRGVGGVFEKFAATRQPRTAELVRGARVQEERRVVERRG
jgi:hypothetical protein